MKVGRILLLVLVTLLLPTLVFAQLSFPQYSGFVNDFENILSNDSALEQKLTQLEKDTTVEVAVITVSDFQGTTIEEYAVKLFEAWKIGKADVDNGLLIIVSANQRQSRFEVGYGLEGTLPDALTGRIQDEYMIPYFRDGDYSTGVEKGIDTVIGIVKEDPTVISALESKPKVDPFKYFDLFVILILVTSSIMSSTKSWWLGGVFGALLGGYFGFTDGLWYLLLITTPLGLLIDYFLSQTTVGKALFRSATGFGSSGRGGSSGISFGGGSSGGGGSSRSW